MSIFLHVYIGYILIRVYVVYILAHVHICFIQFNRNKDQVSKQVCSTISKSSDACCTHACSMLYICMQTYACTQTYNEQIGILSWVHAWNRLHTSIVYKPVHTFSTDDLYIHICIHTDRTYIHTCMHIRQSWASLFNQALPCRPWCRSESCRGWTHTWWRRLLSCPQGIPHAVACLQGMPAPEHVC